ncbi:MAG TPA: BON domain-containing protein [Casimicrobiaceae bacterium]|jgi:hypothetical protein|nr:BON domain-containing protein [Casimicrobiaceae bacterium]
MSTAGSPHRARRHRAVARVLLAAVSLAAGAALAQTGGAASAAAPARANYFNDPFLQVTGAIKDCPVPEGPLVTREEMQIEAHERAERGTRCFDSGFCRLPNSYLYDREIIPRVRKAILADGRFAGTSVWVEGQRRWVWLKGCVRRKSDAAALEKLVRRVDDVEAVVDELVVK